MKKFEIGKSTDRKKFNLWYTNCYKKQIPYIIIIQKMKFSSIEWDYITYKPEVDNKLISSSLEFKEEFFRIFKKYANTKSNYEFSSSVIYVNNISVENAKKFAEELYDVINTIVG